MNWVVGLIKDFFPCGEMLRFRCNVCGRPARAPLSKITREQPTCRCGSSVRLRALVHVLSLGLFGVSRALPDFDRRPDIVGVDMSGAATYAGRLAEKIGYTNTFLHKSPHLDITAPDPTWLGKCDFVISSDVLEHVAPPVSPAFRNMMLLLKPGGVLVFTVPYAKTGNTVEHFPALHDFHLETHDRERILVNVTAQGERQEFDHLVFHGGEGETLEMRVFSETAVLKELQQAGFEDIRIHKEPCLEFGIFWPQDWSLPISARRPKD
ncbi:MAG: methyltransferase domain-containing protein [Nitrosomonadales bacterium]|nr:methyltransferase domain-containing protein [Nitrosomonadales bacterium]